MDSLLQISAAALYLVTTSDCTRNILCHSMHIITFATSKAQNAYVAEVELGSLSVLLVYRHDFSFLEPDDWGYTDIQAGPV